MFINKPVTSDTGFLTKSILLERDFGVLSNTKKHETNPLTSD